MSQIHATYADMIGQLTQEYVRYTPASALFYRDKSLKPGLRIESIELMKEFVNTISFGKDPEGLLFYNEKSDFNNLDTPVTYKVYYNTEKVKSIKVKFYYSEQDSDPFTTFLARDSSVPIKYLQDGKGVWHDLKIGACSTEITKSSDAPTVTLTMGPLGKRVSFKVKHDPKAGSIKTYGAFGFCKLADLTGHCVASYNDDRIIFFSSKDKTKILAVFFPTTSRLGIDDHDDPNPPIATWEDLF